MDENEKEKTWQEEEDEAFLRWFWDKYKHQPDDLEQWCEYWLHDD